jgi:hypothetical protein
VWRQTKARDRKICSAPFVEPPVRAWPIMVLASLFFGFTVMLFGRKSKADDPHDTDSEI